AHAGRLAAVDMVIEAGTVRGLAGEIPVARPHREDAADDLEGLSQRGDIGVRPEVARPGDRDPAHDEHARERFTQGYRYLWIALVVAQPDVEPRLVLLDEIVLEQQCLRLIRHH